MSVEIKDANGNWVRAAGNGKAEYGASTVRSGTVIFTGTSWQSANIVFDTPMPDSDYELSFYCEGEASGVYSSPFCVENKTANGFVLKIYTQNGGAGVNATVRYTAFKLYTDKEYNEVLDVLNVESQDLTVTFGGITAKNAYVKKNNKTVQFYFDDVRDHSGISVSSWTTVATLPEGYRPSKTVYAFCGGVNSTMLLQINSSGRVQVYFNNNLDYEFIANVTYILDD